MFRLHAEIDWRLNLAGRQLRYRKHVELVPGAENGVVAGVEIGQTGRSAGPPRGRTSAGEV